MSLPMPSWRVSLLFFFLSALTTGNQTNSACDDQWLFFFRSASSGLLYYPALCSSLPRELLPFEMHMSSPSPTHQHSAARESPRLSPSASVPITVTAIWHTPVSISPRTIRDSLLQGRCSEQHRGSSEPGLKTQQARRLNTPCSYSDEQRIRRSFPSHTFPRHLFLSKLISSKLINLMFLNVSNNMSHSRIHILDKTCKSISKEGVWTLRTY